MHEELKERLSLGKRSTDIHEGKAKYDEHNLRHVDEKKALLIQEPIADSMPKRESNEKGKMSLITEHKR